MGCDLGCLAFLIGLLDFNPRIPYGMRRGRGAVRPVQGFISIHASRMGCDRHDGGRRESECVFQSTHPVWDATSSAASTGISSRFQSTHPVWDATTWLCAYLRGKLFQSTHPVWDATARLVGVIQFQCISIHASRMGCDTCALPLTASCKRFQSTHPVWDATRRAPSHAQYARFQSTHPVWDATTLRQQAAEPHGFQSTHPVWDATIQADTTPVNRGISIHASRMGCDIALIAWHRVPRISIHASRMGCDAPRFGSAVSAGISIHASRMGCDSTNIRTHSSIVYFNPRIPYGMRR